MYKKILLILFLFCFSVKAEVVNKLDVTGNNRVNKETIKVYGNIIIGKDYSNFELNSITKNLYDTNFFEDINLSLNNGILTIKLKEYPVINDIKIIGEKSKNITETILDKLQLKNKESFISNKLNEDVDLIKDLYASIGFNFVEVKTKIQKFSENRINLLFEIQKGDKTYIKKINFIGDKKIKDSRLRDIIVSEEKKFWKILSKNTFYNKETINLDKRLILNYYKSLGYYDVQVLSNESEINEDGFSELTYTINAGERYKIKKISTNISEVFNKKIFLPLESVYEEYIGEYYSPFKIKKLLDNVDLLIAKSDLQFVNHSVNEVIESNNINVIINIFESEKLTIEKINIYGNDITNEAVIRSELLLDEGDPFNNLKLDQSIARLKNRNIFGQINTNISDGSKNNLKIIDINIEEKATGEISAGAGFGTSGGTFAFDISENNWLGKGIGLTTSFSLNSDSLTGTFSVNDPNFNYTGNSLNYYVSNVKNDKPNSGYKNNILSTGIGTKFEQYSNIFLSPNIGFSYDDLKVDNTASAALKKQKGTFTELSFDYDIINDQRDRVFGPTSGHLISFNQIFPLYADSPFLKNTLSLSKYNSFSENVIGSFKFYASSINGLKSEDVRLSKRIWLPSSRLRGFELGKVGPKDGSDYVGGNYAIASNIELNFPNFFPDSSNLDIGTFLDLGNIWHVDYDSQVNDSNKLRSTIGLNTSYLSPVGPMSLIFSQNLSKAGTDVTESFNFRLGTTF